MFFLSQANQNPSKNLICSQIYDGTVIASMILGNVILK